MGSCLFMTDIDYPDSLLDAAVQEPDDVTTGERKDDVDSLGLEGSSHDLAAMDLHDARL